MQIIKRGENMNFKFFIFAAMIHFTINSMEPENKPSQAQAITLSKILGIAICEFRNGWKIFKAGQPIHITKDDHAQLAKLSRLTDRNGKKYFGRQANEFSDEWTPISHIGKIMQPGFYTLAADSLYNKVQVVFDSFDQDITQTNEALHLVLTPSSNAKKDAITKYNLSIIYLETEKEYEDITYEEIVPSCFELTKTEK